MPRNTFNSRGNRGGPYYTRAVNPWGRRIEYARNALLTGLPYAIDAGKYLGKKVLKKLGGYAERKIARKIAYKLAPSKKYGSSSGHKVGRFAKPKRKLNKSMAKKNVFQRKGHLKTEELYGTVQDPNIVYIGHTTFARETLAEVIAISILRKLFEKAGLANVIWDNAPGLTTLTTTSPTGTYEIQFTRQIVAGTTTETNPITAGRSIKQIASDCNLKRDINLAMQGDDGSNRGDFVEISLFLVSFDGVRTLVANMSFKDMKLHVAMETKIKIQNRTKGADAGDIYADAVDNQPLQGYLYQCRGVPYNQVRTQSFEAISLATGIVKGIGASLAAGYLDPPNPKTFKNCTMSSKILLQPGDIKSGYISDKWAGNFNYLIGTKLRTRDKDTTNVKSVPGKSQLYALEEVINTGPTNPIQIQFEVERMIGSYVTFKKSVLSLSDFEGIAIA